MATGLPDYYRGIDLAYQSLSTAAVDIVAQTLSNLSVDLVAQTLAKLDVDITAQTLSNLSVDIAAQTLSNLSVDLAAQTLAKLDVDIIAQTLSNLSVDIAAQTLSNLNVDIAAQTLSNLNVDLVAQTLSQLNIDIIAQTLANLDINVNAQSLGQLINRPKYGGAIRTAGSYTLSANENKTLVTIEGKGMIYGGTIRLEYTSSQKDSIVRLECDGEILCDESFWNLSGWEINKPRSFPLTINRYSDTVWNYCCGISYGFTFETSLALAFHEQHGTTPTVYYEVAYALV